MSFSEIWNGGLFTPYCTRAYGTLRIHAVSRTARSAFTQYPEGIRCTTLPIAYATLRYQYDISPSFTRLLYNSPIPSYNKSRLIVCCHTCSNAIPCLVEIYNNTIAAERLELSQCISSGLGNSSII
ncbi:hypothetical protein [Trichormus azollae]|uniref:hypothetical protein n=1 Tax=Trichormus azollae TaxID=1164 RepID=UPI00325E5A2A